MDPIPHDVLIRFAESCLRAVGVSPERSAIVAEVLVDADLRGVDSHGCARLRRYVDGVRAGAIDPSADVKAVVDTPALAVLDAGNGLGQVAGRQAVDLAAEKAKALGCGVVLTRRSNHFGTAGYYARRAADQGMVGLVMSNASPQVAPTHGAQPMFGTNPLAYAVPGRDGPAVLYDASTSVVPRGRLERLSRGGHERVPDGWIQAPDGSHPSLAEAIGQLKARQGSAILPLGGAGEATSGHKGFGMGLLVELLCGPLAGASWGRNVYGEGGADIGQFYFCMDAGSLGSSEEAVGACEALAAHMRATPPLDPARPVRLPGDRSAETRRERLAHGVPLSPPVAEDLAAVAAQCGVEPLMAAADIATRP